MNKLTLSFALYTFLTTAFAADVYAPKPLSLVFEDAIGSQWTPSSISTVENRDHVIIIDNTGSYCLRVGVDIKGSLGAAEVASIKDGTGTYGDALRSMFQVLDMNISTLADNNLSGTFTIHPELASYYAADADGTNLTIRDKSSYYQPEQSTSAYLVFTITNTQSSLNTIKAYSRYIYSSNTGDYAIDNSWQDHCVKLNTYMTVTLTATESEATEWTFADANGLIDVSTDQGSDFNPGSTTWQPNSFAAYPTNNNGEISAWDYDNSGLKTYLFYNNVDDDYQNQLGHSEAADAAAAEEPATAASSMSVWRNSPLATASESEVVTSLRMLAPPSVTAVASSRTTIVYSTSTLPAWSRRRRAALARMSVTSAPASAAGRVARIVCAKASTCCGSELKAVGSMPVSTTAAETSTTACVTVGAGVGAAAPGGMDGLGVGAADGSGSMR